MLSSGAAGLTIGSPSSFWTAGSTFETRYSWKDSWYRLYISSVWFPVFCVHILYTTLPEARAHHESKASARGGTAATHRRQCSGSGAAGRPQKTRPCRGATMGGQQCTGRGQQPASQQLLAAQPTVASPPLDRRQPGTVTGAGAGAGGARVRLRGVGDREGLFHSVLDDRDNSINRGLGRVPSLFEADRVVHH